jgi:TonB family protein
MKKQIGIAVMALAMITASVVNADNRRLLKAEPEKPHKTASGPMSISSAKALATYAPRPQYPYAARSRLQTGRAVVVIDIGASGSVTSARILVSTGWPILDNASTSAFRQWRFKPGTVSMVKIPIAFTMSRATY